MYIIVCTKKYNVSNEKKTSNIYGEHVSSSVRNRMIIFDLTIIMM